VFILKHLDEITGGNQDLAREIAGLFVVDCPHQLEALRETLRAGDLAAVEHCAHDLKGSIANFDLGEAYEAARRLEAVSREGDLELARTLFDQLERGLGDCLARLKAHLDLS
jgi:HPt (histidine-containing phosphotransfer) domain-containing protein